MCSVRQCAGPGLVQLVGQIHPQHQGEAPPISDKIGSMQDVNERIMEHHAKNTIICSCWNFHGSRPLAHD